MTRIELNKLKWSVWGENYKLFKYSRCCWSTALCNLQKKGCGHSKLATVATHQKMWCRHSGTSGRHHTLFIFWCVATVANLLNQLKNNQNSLTKFSCVDLNIYEVFSDQFFAYFYSPSYMVHCCSVLTVISNVVVRWGYWLLPIIMMVSYRDPLLLFHHCCWASFLHTDLEFSRNGEKTRMLSNNMSLVYKN